MMVVESTVTEKLFQAYLSYTVNLDLRLRAVRTELGYSRCHCKTFNQVLKDIYGKLRGQCHEIQFFLLRISFARPSLVMGFLPPLCIFLK
jgi:hypothetical protein